MEVLVTRGERPKIEARGGAGNPIS
eukprot:COSAG05_NODE_21107_length_274_cov_0.822857_1_plen_24_part_10